MIIPSDHDDDPAQRSRIISNLAKETFAMVLAGGRGRGLGPLTEWRCHAALPFGGKFRIIDFSLSNCINSGIRRIGVLTQYKAHSLIRHLHLGWGFFRGELNEFVGILPAQQRLAESWYRGTADAVFQNIDILRTQGPRYVLILASDHVYKMDYGMMLAEHAQSHADMTIACLEVPIHEAHAFGVVTVDESERITSFQEKPANPTAVPDKPEQALVSMGVYLFKSEFLFDQLIRNADIADSGHDFGKDIIPNIVSEHCVMAHRFRRSCNLSAQRCYWRDIGNIDAYWEANMELIQTTPALNLYDRTWPIWTYQEQLPPAKFIFDSPSRRGVALDSLVSGGCIISGAMVRRSVLFSNVVVDGGKTLVEDSLLLPDVHISPGARLRRTIVERGTEIPPGLVAGESADDDARRFYRSPRGVTLINSAMLKNGRVPSESPALGSIPPGWADQ